MHEHVYNKFLEIYDTYYKPTNPDLSKINFLKKCFNNFREHPSRGFVGLRLSPQGLCVVRKYKMYDDEYRFSFVNNHRPLPVMFHLGLEEINNTPYFYPMHAISRDKHSIEKQIRSDKLIFFNDLCALHLLLLDNDLMKLFKHLGASYYHMYKNSDTVCELAYDGRFSN